MKNESIPVLGSETNCTGCFTQFRYVQGRTLIEIEQILGFAEGRFSNGIYAGFLLDKPKLSEFEMYGYTTITVNTWKNKNDKPTDKDRLPADQRNFLKKFLFEEIFATTGQLALVKIFPIIPHDPKNDENDKEKRQYIEGLGAPQWELTKKLSVKITAIVLDYPNGKLNLTP